MNIINKLTFLAVFILLSFSCGKDRESTSDIYNNDFKLLYNFYLHGTLGANVFIEDGDILELFVGDTIALQIVPDSKELETVERISHGSYLETTQWLPLNYQCVATKTGSTPVSVIYADAVHYFVVNIAQVKKTYLIWEAPSYIVKTSDESLSIKIADEVEELYHTFFFNRIRFYYNTKYSGDIEIVNLDFTKSTSGAFLFDEDMLILNYNDATNLFNVEETKDKYDSMILKCDLTEYYMMLYPMHTIDYVGVSLSMIPITE